MNIIDYSRRRGTIVHFMPQIYALLKENVINLPHMTLWKQAIKADLVDINRKWVFALIGYSNVMGFLFYHLKGTDSVYIDQLIVAKRYKEQGVINALLLKFEHDSALKTRTSFYVSRSIKREVSEEILENVGLANEDVYDSEGYQLLGNLEETMTALKLRYIR